MSKKSPLLSKRRMQDVSFSSVDDSYLALAADIDKELSRQKTTTDNRT
ncbi:MAG: hypothetical protein IPL92_15255 [Saprospiraceae bacterium]|nr:hypothetical protein [Candidatus Opimibacter iunctus]